MKTLNKILLVLIGMGAMLFGFVPFCNAAGPICANPPAGLVSWWPGDGNADDIVGANNGTLVGGTTFAPGLVGQAFSFNGIDGYADLGNDSSLHVSVGDFTVDAWVKFNTLQSDLWGNMSIVDKMAANGTNVDGWMLIKQADDRFWFCLGGRDDNHCVDPAYTVFSTSRASTTDWFHLAAVKSSSGISIYINGVLEDSRSPLPDFLDSDSANLRIGSSALYGAHLNGLVDEVDIFNRALSAAEIKAIFDAGRAGKRACVMSVPSAGVRPTIDGYLWEWGALQATHLDRTNAASITGSETSPSPADLSADLRGAWWPGLLYFAAAVTDDVLVGNQSAKAWNDDAVELSVHVPSTGKMHPFTIGLDGRQYDNGSAISSLTVMTRTVPGGWTLETVIPAWVLGLDALAAGEAYPFTFGLWDDDTRSTPARTHVLWRGTVTDSYQPDWGTLQLSSTVYDFPTGATPTPTATPTQAPTRTPTATLTPTPTASGCTQPPAGLVSWWPGDGTAENIVGPNDGTLIGDAPFAPGLVDEAFSLDGDGDWVDLGNNPIYNFGSSDFAISLWVYWNTLAGEQVLIEKWDDGPAFEGIEHAGWTLVKMANNVLRFATGQGGSSGIDLDGIPAGIAPGTWNHVTVSRQSGLITIYWNGEKIATGYIRSMKDTPFPLLLGRRYDSRGHFHNGLIDEVVLFDRALSAAEIQAIFSAGSAGICKGAHHPSYAVSGTVTSDRGAPLPGVAISANGVRRAVTDLNGIYSMNVYTGTYTISAASRCFAFSPQTRSVTVPPDSTGQDFIGRNTCVRLPLVYRNWPPLPAAPVLNPISATSFDSYRVTWSAPANAVSYTLEEDSNTSFSKPTTVYGGPSNTWQASGKAAGDICYHVRASNQYGAGPWSNAQCITLAQLVDDFSVPANGWPVGSDDIAWTGYASGEYRILAKQPHWVIQGGPDVYVTDFRCQVEARNAAHLNGAYGITFAATDAGFYLYEVGYGQFALQRYDRPHKTWTTLLAAQPHPAIHQGSRPNRVAVIRRGATITLYVNDSQVGQAVDGVLGAGYVGLAAIGDSANYDARFDNFLLAYMGGGSQMTGAAGERDRPGFAARIGEANLVTAPPDR